MNISPRDADGHHSPANRGHIGRVFYRSVTYLTLIAMLFGGFLLMAPQASAQDMATVNTDALNLRTGPGTDYAIITVMPGGTAVSLDGGAENGWYPVSYNGYSGYASGEFLAIGGGNSSAGNVATDGATGTAYVIDGRLNLRDGASMSSTVILVMEDGAAVTLTGEYGNGFLGVVYNGTYGYAWADYLSTSGGSTPQEPVSPPSDNVTGTATVAVDALNIRSGPGTGYGVLGVMQYGATVSLTGDSANGFVGMSWNGIQGWTFADYLSTGAVAPDPAPDSGSVAIGDTVVGSGYIATDALNLRTGPGTSYSVITVMYSGAGVEIMGDPQAGFYPLRYNGTKGWASGDYLGFGAAPTPPAPGESSTDDIIAIIYAAADRYGQPREDMLRVARCESVLDPNAVNPLSGTSGLFQFLPSTWATTPYADQNIFDPVANANAAGWMWSVGRRGEWACQ